MWSPMTAQALADGADEIDLVLPYRAFLAGDTDTPAAMVDAVRAVVPADSHRLKVILETGELVDPAAIHGAAELAVEHGADFIKTSTGKTTVERHARGDRDDARRHPQGAGRTVGLKPSGGIRTLADATRLPHPGRRACSAPTGPHRRRSASAPAGCSPR